MIVYIKGKKHTNCYINQQSNGGYKLLTSDQTEDTQPLIFREIARDNKSQETGQNDLKMPYISQTPSF